MSKQQGFNNNDISKDEDQEMIDLLQFWQDQFGKLKHIIQNRKEKTDELIKRLAEENSNFAEENCKLKERNGELEERNGELEERLRGVDVELRGYRRDRTGTEVSQPSDSISKKTLENLRSEYQRLVEQDFVNFYRLLDYTESNVSPKKNYRKEHKSKVRSFLAEILLLGENIDLTSAIADFKSNINNLNLSLKDDDNNQFERLFNASSTFIKEITSRQEEDGTVSLQMPKNGEKLDFLKHTVVSGCSDNDKEIIQFGVYPALIVTDTINKKDRILFSALVYTSLT